MGGDISVVVTSTAVRSWSPRYRVGIDVGAAASLSIKEERKEGGSGCREWVQGGNDGNDGVGVDGPSFLPALVPQTLTPHPSPLTPRHLAISPSPRMHDPWHGYAPQARLLAQARADGLNHVQIYVFWNFHERTGIQLRSRPYLAIDRRPPDSEPNRGPDRQPPPCLT